MLLNNLIFKKYVGDSDRIWLIPTGRFPADNIHTFSPFAQSKGYCGNSVTFNLDDGSILTLEGPWHSNPEELFFDTGIDIRGKHSTQVYLSTRVDFNPDLHNSLYYEEEPHEGFFNRGELLAQEFANELNKPIFYITKTAGGSHSGSVQPKLGYKE